MDRQNSPGRQRPPAYTAKPSLDPVRRRQSLPGPAQPHGRFVPGGDDPPTSGHDDLLARIETCPAELPPTYTPLDENLRAFTLRPPLIHATGSSTADFPRYQLEAQYTSKGLPYRLWIRRLLGSESRRLSRAAESGNGDAPTATTTTTNGNIPFDQDTTLYMIEHTHGLSSSSWLTAATGPGDAPRTLRIYGRRRGTLGGHIEYTRGRRGAARFQHVTRNAAGDALREANEARMRRRGYRPDEEVSTAPLFCVAGGGEWSDAAGAIVAAEAPGGESLRLLDPLLDVAGRDLLVACWAAKSWSGSWRRA